MIARRIVVRGLVQGVGYRDAAVQAAFAIGVHGWVRNRRDGTVEAFAQGEREHVLRFIDWCKRGPPLARVSAVEAEELDADAALRDFSFRPTA